MKPSETKTPPPQNPDEIEKATLSGHFDSAVAIHGDAADFSNAIGTIYKPNGPVLVNPIFQFWNNQNSEKLQKDLRLGFAIVVLLFLLTGGTIFYSFYIYPFQRPAKMEGGFRILIAPLIENGNTSTSQVGKEISTIIYSQLNKEFSETGLNLEVSLWGPDHNHYISGTDKNQRAQSAETLAQEINADMIIYGSFTTTGENIEIAPEFYLSINNAYEADEILGQYDLGAPFSVSGFENLNERTEINDQLIPRIKALTTLTTGLARYSSHNFEKALSTLHSAENLEWVKKDPQFQQLLYVLMGNSAGKQNDMLTAENYYSQALNLGSDYARTYTGLGNVRYIQAVNAYSESVTSTALLKLDQSAAYYQQALQSPNKPAQADIDSKSHFGLGRIYFLQALIHKSDMSSAIREFQWVINDYETTSSERLRERVAESHAMLGLIYRLSQNNSLALVEYKEAITLTVNVAPLQEQTARYYAALGKLYIENDQLQEACDAFREATKMTRSLELKSQYQQQIEQIPESLEGK